MASKHLVTCVQCGNQFDANRGGYYNRQTRRYTCKSCARKMKADRNERTTGMRQSKGAMIAKIAVGVLFVIAGFSSPESGWSVGYFLTALVIGAALIAWGIAPALQSKRKASAEAEARAEARRALENEPKRCPACGATSKGKYCEYCGSKL